MNNHPTSCDVLVIGGGVMGSAIAYHLALMSGRKTRVIVIERDPTHEYSSTALSAASIRMQFSNRINVEISKFGGDFIRDFPSLFSDARENRDLAFREDGYLFLAGNEAQAETLRANCEIQRAGGADTRLLEPDALRQRFAFLNLTDITLGALGARGEGWFDNMGLLSGFRALARDRGVCFLHDEVVGLQQRRRGAITFAELASGGRISAGTVVNAAGTRARRVARFVGIDLPVEPRKRTTFAFRTQNAGPARSPLIVDNRGVYFRPEGNGWIAACQPEVDPAVALDDFEPRYHEFDDVIWPRLAHRSELFEAIRMQNAWAGHYAYNTLDQNAIIGRHRDVENLVFANGFSGHGLQQSPAVGRGVAELVLFGRFKSLDLSDLGPGRIIEAQPFREFNIV